MLSFSFHALARALFQHIIYLQKHDTNEVLAETDEKPT